MYCSVWFESEHLSKNSSSRSFQEKGAAPTELDQEVAKAIFDIEVSPSCDIKAELKDVYISGAKDVEVGKAGMAMVVHFPFRVWKIVKKIQGRLIRELEKKFNRKHVVLVANRTILDKNFRRKGLKVRPRSRTLTAVHESILEDLVGPTEIVGKRTRISVDGSKLMKILLDPKDKDKENIESKLPAFAAVYKKLTNKEAQFMFPTVWNVKALPSTWPLWQLNASATDRRKCRVCETCLFSVGAPTGAATRWHNVCDSLLAWLKQKLAHGIHGPFCTCCPDQKSPWHNTRIKQHRGNQRGESQRISHCQKIFFESNSLQRVWLNCCWKKQYHPALAY